MTTKKFDATPSSTESISLDDISVDHMKEAWKDYEAKPEYKKFNKHDLIDSMVSPKQETIEQSEG